jgi:hypothetical protein
MISRRTPPPVATWLLKHLQCGRHKEAILGDLLQLHQEGRSNWWYWRQVLSSVLHSYLNAARTGGPSLLIGLCAAWAAILTWKALNGVFIRISDDLYLSLRDAAGSSNLALDARNEVLVLTWGIGALFRTVCFGVSGWLIARLNPNQQRVAVATLAISVFVWPMPWEQIRVIEVDAPWLIHYGSALIGMSLGAWLANLRRSAKNGTIGAA